MNKDKFNRLDVLEQINYINTQLDNSSLTSICKNIGISRSTIRDRFKKLDYSYSKELNRYIYNQSITDVSQGIENQNNGCITEHIHKENNISTTDVLQDNTVMSIINKSDEDIRFIRRLKRDIEERGRTLEAVINQYLLTVKPMFNKFVNPSSRYADIIIPNDNKHDVAVDFLVAKIKDILNTND